MNHSVQSPSVYRFGVFEVDLLRRELRKHGIRIRLQEKPFQLLEELVRRPGEVIGREELRQRLWTPDTFVDFDEGLNTAVKRLRGGLGDSAENPVYIETVSRYGYRFIAPVTTAGPREGEPRHGESSPPSLSTVPPRRLDVAHKDFWSFSWQKLSLMAVIVATFGIATSRIVSFRSATNPAIRSIAVLPLENLSGDSSQEYFVDGITDEITTELAKLAGPRVISRTSAMQYRGTHKTIPEIGRELKVDAILEGSVERSGNRVHVRMQMIEASRDRHLWAEKYDRQLNDVLQLEGDVARDIARQVQLQLSERQRQQFARSRSVNDQGFQDYLQGRHYWALRTREGLNQAVGYFNRAIEEDPTDARSYAGLAHCYIVLPMLTDMPRDGGLGKAQQSAAKALALDDSLPEAHLAVAEVLLYHDWNFAGAEKEFRRTLELNPNYSTGHQWYAEYLGLMARHDEAIREIQKAIELDPLSAIAHHQAGSILRNARHYEEALNEYREALRLSPSLHFIHVEIAWALRWAGRIPEAIQATETDLAAIVDEYQVDPGVLGAVKGLRSAYEKGGRVGYLRQSLKCDRYALGHHYYFSRDYAQLGDHDAAIAELERSFQAHDMELLYMLADPDLDPLRADPRFQRLIRAVGFPQ